MANKQNNLQPAAENSSSIVTAHDSPSTQWKLFLLNFKVMLHVTIRNDDF